MRVSNTLEKRRPLLLLSGLIIALSFTLAAFEWRTPYTGPVIPEEPGTSINIEDEDPPITIRKNKPKTVVKRSAAPQPKAKPIEVQIDPELLKEDIEPIDAPDDFPDIDDPDVPDVIDWPTEPKIVPSWKATLPEYLAGAQQLTIDLKANMDEPRYCYEMDDGASVWVRFTVDENGNVKDPEVVRSESRCFEASAVEAVMSLGKFKPAEYQGRSVPVHMYQKFKFKLE